MAVMFDTYCGLVCEGCEFQNAQGCKGCITTEGNPFHGNCEIANCAKSRGKRFCGECGDLPCELLKSYSYDAQHGDDGARIENCRIIKAKLVAEARQGVNPVSICGHHCDYCFMGQWCGGCRSSYNGCSYATVCDSNICPNVACATERNLDGCYQCEDLLSCKKGYYGIETEYVAKATALFLKKYGSHTYTATLKQAVEAGINYPKAFDETGSVEKAFELLEKIASQSPDIQPHNQ